MEPSPPFIQSNYAQYVCSVQSKENAFHLMRILVQCIAWCPIHISIRSHHYSQSDAYFALSLQWYLNEHAPAIEAFIGELMPKLDAISKFRTQFPPFEALYYIFQLEADQHLNDTHRKHINRKFPRLKDHMISLEFKRAQEQQRLLHVLPSISAAGSTQQPSMGDKKAQNPNTAITSTPTTMPRAPAIIQQLTSQPIVSLPSPTRVIPINEYVDMSSPVVQHHFMPRQLFDSFVNNFGCVNNQFYTNKKRTMMRPCFRCFFKQLKVKPSYTDGCHIPIPSRLIPESFHYLQKRVYDDYRHLYDSERRVGNRYRTCWNSEDHWPYPSFPQNFDPRVDSGENRPVAKHYSPDILMDTFRLMPGDFMDQMHNMIEDFTLHCESRFICSRKSAVYSLEKRYEDVWYIYWNKRFRSYLTTETAFRRWVVQFPQLVSTIPVDSPVRFTTALNKFLENEVDRIPYEVVCCILPYLYATIEYYITTFEMIIVLHFRLENMLSQGENWSWDLINGGIMMLWDKQQSQLEAEDTQYLGDN